MPRAASDRRSFLKGSTALGLALAGPLAWPAGRAEAAVPTTRDPRFTAPVIDPKAIPQFEDALPLPGAG